MSLLPSFLRSYPSFLSLAPEDNFDGCFLQTSISRKRRCSQNHLGAVGYDSFCRIIRPDAIGVICVFGRCIQQRDSQH